jgi:putative oxidoreductase
MAISLSFLNKFEDHALLFLRLGLGAAVAYHGYPLFMGGPSKWVELGGAMAAVGISDYPAVWGFTAAVSQFFGGIFTAFGLGTRIWAVLLGMTFTVAAITHFRAGDGMAAAAHAGELAIVFYAMIVLGPGRFSIDAKIS